MNDNKDFNKTMSELSKRLTNVNFDNLTKPDIPRIEIPEINLEPIKYENSIFKDLANDINKSNKAITNELEKLNKSQDDSSKLNHKILYISFAALLVSLIPYIFKLVKFIYKIITIYFC